MSLGLLARPWKLSVFRFVAGHRRSAPVRYAARMATAFMAAYDNDDGSLVHDGELDLLRRVAAANPRIVLDVGAHHGEWSLAALDSLATATVYAIEPAPPNLRILRQRVAGRASVRVVEAALGEASGPATLHFDQRHPSTASLVLPDSLDDRLRTPMLIVLGVGRRTWSSPPESGAGSMGCFGE